MIDRPLTGWPFAARRVGFRFVHIASSTPCAYYVAHGVDRVRELRQNASRYLSRNLSRRVNRLCPPVHRRRSVYCGARQNRARSRGSRWGPRAMTQARALVGSIDTVALSRSPLDDAAATLPPAGFARLTLSTSQRWALTRCKRPRCVHH
jgi:hypothetical protein